MSSRGRIMIKKKLKIHIKKGDTVKIISGKYKGKTGEVTKIITKTGKIIIKNINIITKHIKPKKEGETGQIISIEAPIYSSKVKIYNETSSI
uniref:Large ribosomal subunit protein uL24c n=1 Tax=Sebdenia flabellata TaxID=42024 RepID=A0A1C9CA71_9FLOR|nr:ribosomal protein L24 [Sebdenia flabellata]AOM65281.1 ribosomal protein L24 [Sebdenia flabellata]